MKFLRTFIDLKQVGPHPVRKFLFIAAIVIIAVILLAIFLPLGAEHHPTVVAYGFISFGVTFLIVWISLVLYGITSTIYGFRKYPTLWKPSVNQSMAYRYKQSLRMRRLDDPFLNKIGRYFSHFGTACFLIWVIQFLIAAVILIQKGY